MARGKAQRKSSMRGKRGMQYSRAGDERDTGKKVAGDTATSREGPLEQFSARPMASRGGRAGKGTRQPRKSDI